MNKGRVAYLPIAGSVILLAAWLVQQTIFDDVNSRLSRLNAAEGSFQQYRALGPIFASLRFMSPSDVANEVAEAQRSSYMVGIEYVKRAISPDVYRAAFEQFESSGYIEPSQPDLRRLREWGILDLALTRDRESLERRKNWTQYVFWAMNVVGSLLIIIGGVAKIQDERSESGEAIRTRSAL